MTTGDFYKGTAWVLFIVSFIGAILVTASSGLGFSAFFSFVLSVFVLCLIIYALGAIIENLEWIYSNTYHLYRQCAKKDESDK